MLSTRTHFRPREMYRQKVRKWRKIFHANKSQKKAKVAILISEKIDFKIKTVTRDKQGHYLMIKGSVQEDIKENEKRGKNIYMKNWVR